ncbi:MAG: AAA family ATPase [Deltaproteobacteria bacterium]|nr:AAA family ATPase [Deltaproteobacteria bacterium]
MPELLTREERARLQGETQGITQQRMLREITQALEVLAAESPLVLLLEDLHWSDFSTLALISTIARRSEPARLLIIGTYRPVEILARDHPLRTMKQELELHRNCEELRLKLLSEPDIQDYLAMRLKGDAPRQFGALAPVIHARTDGNPLFMVNMVDYLLADAGLLVGSRQISRAEWDEMVRTHRLDALRTIRHMIERNLELLKPEEQAILEAASVAGAEFSAASVAAAWIVRKAKSRPTAPGCRGASNSSASSSRSFGPTARSRPAFASITHFTRRCCTIDSHQPNGHAFTGSSRPVKKQRTESAPLKLRPNWLITIAAPT